MFHRLQESSGKGKNFLTNSIPLGNQAYGVEKLEGNDLELFRQIYLLCREDKFHLLSKVMISFLCSSFCMLKNYHSNPIHKPYQGNTRRFDLGDTPNLRDFPGNLPQECIFSRKSHFLLSIFLNSKIHSDNPRVLGKWLEKENLQSASD